MRIVHAHQRKMTRHKHTETDKTMKPVTKIEKVAAVAYYMFHLVLETIALKK